MNKLELAWAAGFFDGEGCIISAPRTSKNSATLILAISQAGSAKRCPEVLVRFSEVFKLYRYRTGCGPETKTRHLRRVRFKKARYYTKAWRPLWMYSIGGLEKVQATIAMLWPWLGTIKQEQYIRSVKKYLAASHKRS